MVLLVRPRLHYDGVGVLGENASLGIPSDIADHLRDTNELRDMIADVIENASPRFETIYRTLVRYMTLFDDPDLTEFHIDYSTQPKGGGVVYGFRIRVDTPNCIFVTITEEIPGVDTECRRINIYMDAYRCNDDRTFATALQSVNWAMPYNNQQNIVLASCTAVGARIPLPVSVEFRTVEGMLTRLANVRNNMSEAQATICSYVCKDLLRMLDAEEYLTDRIKNELDDMMVSLGGVTPCDRPRLPPLLNPPM